MCYFSTSATRLLSDFYFARRFLMRMSGRDKFIAYSGLSISSVAVLLSDD